MTADDRTQSQGPDDSLKDLGRRLRHAREQQAAPKATPGGGLIDGRSGFGAAFRIGVELVAALGVGVAIGLLLDRWLDTGPWFLVVFFFLGAGAGVLNVYRAASGIGMGPGYSPPDGLLDGPGDSKAPERREADETEADTANRTD